MKKTDLAYFAGIIDGEGSIFIVRNQRGKGHYFHAVVSVGSIDEWLLHQLRFSFGGSIHLSRKGPLNKKPFWKWMLTSKKALSFLEAILPYLRLKRAQAEIAITLEHNVYRGGKHCRSIPPGELAIREVQKILVGNLNQRKGPNV